MILANFGWTTTERISRRAATAATGLARSNIWSTALVWRGCGVSNKICSFHIPGTPGGTFFPGRDDVPATGDSGCYPIRPDLRSGLKN